MLFYLEESELGDGLWGITKVILGRLVVDPLYL